MAEKTILKQVYRIPVEKGYREFVDQTYSSFLSLARQLNPGVAQLTEYPLVDQLQNLFFLVREGYLEVSEEKSADNSEFLFLSVHHNK